MPDKRRRAKVRVIPSRPTELAHYMNLALDRARRTLYSKDSDGNHKVSRLRDRTELRGQMQITGRMRSLLAGTHKIVTEKQIKMPPWLVPACRDQVRALENCARRVRRTATITPEMLDMDDRAFQKLLNQIQRYELQQELEAERNRDL